MKKIIYIALVVLPLLSCGDKQGDEIKVIVTKQQLVKTSFGLLTRESIFWDIEDDKINGFLVTMYINGEAVKTAASDSSTLQKYINDMKYDACSKDSVVFSTICK